MRSLLLSSAILLTACGASVSADAEAQPSTNLSDDEFDTRLREALMRNPEIILEALEAYQERMESEALGAARDSVAGMLPTLVSGESGHAIGASEADAELVIVEFFDYNCGVCRNAMADVLSRGEADPKVRIVFQEYPVIREQSRAASAASIAAGRSGQDAYLRAHRSLLQSGAANQAAIDSALSRAGFDASQIAETAAENAAEIDAFINKSVALGRQIGPRGTPFFVVANPKSGMFDIMDGYHPVSFGELVERVANSEASPQ